MPMSAETRLSLHCADGAKWIEHNLPDCSVDMVITSPPYDALRDYEGYSFDFYAMAEQCCRALKNGGVMVWVVTDQSPNGCETLTSFEQALFFKYELGMKVETMIAVNEGTGAKGSKRLYWQAHEYMFVCTKGRHSTFNPIVDRANKYAGQTTSGQRRKVNGQMPKKNSRKIAEFGRRTNVWRYGGGNHDDTGHPAPLDYKLAYDHIRTWSNPNDLILDPMCGGSANAANASLALNRRFIGVDIAQRYIDNTRSRIKTPLLTFAQ